MADNMIELVASLNVDDSAKQINKVDIPLLQDKIKGIKIKCELDTEGISSIQSQLANIKINAPQIDLGVGGGSELINNVSHIVDNVEDKIEELRKNLAEKFGVSVDEIVTNTIKNAKGQINSFSFDLTKLSGEVEKFSYKVSRTKQKDKESGKDYTVTSVKAIGSRDSDKGAIQLLERATKAANTLERQMINLKAAADDVSAPRPITSQESIDKVAQAYKNAETAVDNLRTANASTFEELNNEAKKAVDELNNVIKAQRNADTAATKLRAKPIEVVKADELSNLDKFVATISNSAIPDVANLTQRVEELRSELSEVNDKQGLVDYLNKFANVESDFKALVAQAKAVKGALRDLDNLSNNALFQKNKSDPQVSSTLSDIEDIRKEYGQLFAEIGNAKTPEDLQKISNKLAELKPQFDKVTNSANQFKTALSLENIDAGRANRIKRLTADINSYATANKRAVESTKQMTSGRSFADEWSRITSVMAKGADLTDRELKDLSADMAVFRKEAQAAGLAGASAFEKFGNAFKTISTYISANQIINMVISQIRSAVTELQTVDDRLTEISKTSDRTVESLRSLGETAFDTASKYGRTASDYLLGVQEMSRAGFNEQQSEDMAELTILAQAAGDMTADLANQYLIATNAAYDYNGSIVELTDTLDRQNYVTNHYALSMNDLAEATKIAASQAAQSGIGIDEMTAALSTMISTTQQGGEIASRALRGILMNIQQVKGEVGDGEEDITAESLSKYEKAAADLGVSLKEVRNGVVALRDPMVVLDELATAFNKEADDSIKKANLINAIGGKYRGNQLSALLSNWDTYKDILNTFNSEQAVGSAMAEAEKSANNWAGSLNKVKNSWAELVNQFINSDNAISVLQSADKIIQNLSDSATTGSLKMLSDSVASLIKLISELTDKFGTLPTLLAGVMAFKGESLFGGNINQIVTDFKGISVEIDRYNHSVDRANYSQKLFKKGLENTNVDLRGYLSGLNGAQASVKGYVSSLVTARLKTIALDVATAALNATITFGLSWAISAIVKAFDNWVHAEEKAIESAKELRKSGHDSIIELTKESESFEELQKRYIQLYSSTSDINEIKSELSKIQDELIDKYGKEADGIDLVNGNLSEQIENMRKLKREQSEAFIFDAENKKRYEQAKKSLEGTDENARIADSDVTQFFRATVSANSTKELSNLLRAFSESGVNYDKIVTDVWGKEASIAVMGDLKSQVEGWQKLADIYKQIDGYNKDVYDSLMQQYVLAKEKYDVDKADVDEFERQTKYYNSFDIPQNVLDNYNNLINKAGELKSIISGDYTGAEKLRAELELEDVHNELNNISKDYIVLKDDVDVVFNAINDGSQTAIKSVGDLHSAWFESFNEMQKGALKNIDMMKTALQNISDGNLLSSTDFWGLAELDVDHILDGAQLVGDKFQVTEEQLIKLKDTYIQKQIESIKVRQTELEQLKRQEEIEVRQTKSILSAWNYSKMSLNNPKYRGEYNELNNRLSIAKDNVREYQEEWNLNAILLRQYNANLGNTANLLQSAEERAKKLQENADKLSNAYMERIDSVIDGINEEKNALNEEKEALQGQLDILEAQADEIKNIISEYEKVADIVKETIEEEISAIEETYNKQIEALKAQNDEREEAIDLTEKLNALNNAKNNKVVTYTEAGGFRYGVNKEAVNKAQNDYDKALLDSQISNLEKERDSATKELEEYAKLWENATKKATKAEEEELATRILGADWRKKISEQDVEIFDTYQKKYDEYGVSLKRITDVEIANVKKSIDAKDKEIKAKEELLAEWQKYKSNVQKWVNDLKDANQDYADSLDGITLTESSNLDERLSNFETFKDKYMSIIDEIENAQKNIGDIEVNASINAEGFTDGLSELVEGIGTVSEKLAEAIKELGRMPSINSAGDVKYYHATGYEHYASGGVNSSTGLAWLDGTKNRPELVLNNSDATKLYNMLHSMPMSAVQMYTSPFVNTKSGGANQPSTIQISGNTINLPNVQNPQQFAREMERYLQNTLTESQIIPPRK